MKQRSAAALTGLNCPNLDAENVRTGAHAYDYWDNG
jgi:hypothetical protein